MRGAALLLSVLLWSCGGADGDTSQRIGLVASGADSGAVDHPGPTVRTGGEVLADSGFEILVGQRVGLIANQTSNLSSGHLADVLHDAPEVSLRALFGPEHGLRGDADAGASVADGVDDRTGVPVYSLYGNRRAPEPQVLAELDVLVFDIQDVGARFYTYIATMGLAMEAAAEAGIPFVVLDRPNPLGGVLVDGFLLEAEHESFVGPYPIPIQHGLTVGELARMILGEAWIEGAENLELHIVPMSGWSRAMLWPDTGLPWIPTSPNIPDFETALVYPGMCLLEATELNEGRGTNEPFRLLGSPNLSAAALLSAWGDQPGVLLEPAPYRPVSMPGKAANPRFQDEDIDGIRLTVIDAPSVRPVALGVHLLAALVETGNVGLVRSAGLARLAGTDALYRRLLRGESPDSIVQSWVTEVERFRVRRQPYLLYD